MLRRYKDMNFLVQILYMEEQFFVMRRNFRHMQSDILKFSLLPRLFLLPIGCLLLLFLVCRRISAVFTYLSIFLSFYPLSAPPDGGKRLRACEQGSWNVAKPIFFREVKKVVGEREKREVIQLHMAKIMTYYVLLLLF